MTVHLRSLTQLAGSVIGVTIGTVVRVVVGRWGR